MQLKDLMQLFREGQNEGRKRGYVSQGACDAEGIAAVVRALRDEFDLKLPFEVSMTIEEILKSFDQILGDAGEKVADYIRKDTRVVTDPGTAYCAPATDYSRKQCDNCDWPSLPECRKCGYPFAALPATDPAPAVCEWTPDVQFRDAFTTECGYVAGKRPAGSPCICAKPIKFTEAKT